MQSRTRCLQLKLNATASSRIMYPHSLSILFLLLFFRQTLCVP